MSQYRGNIEIITSSEEIVTLPFCTSIKKKPMRLVQFVNDSADHKMQIIIKKVDMRFGVPPKGFFYCVMCGDAFVQAVPMLVNHIFDTIICDGLDYHEFDIDDEHYEFDEEIDYQKNREKEPPIFSPGYFRLGMDYNGKIIMNDRYPYVLTGNPLVYVQDGLGIDSEGNAVIPEENRADKLRSRIITNRFGKIMAGIFGLRLCISGDRQLVYCQQPVLKGKKVISIACGYHAYVVLLHNGEVRYSRRGTRWSKLTDQAVSISVEENTIAVANKSGEVLLFSIDKDSMCECGKLLFENRYISEIAVCEKKLAVRFADCTFDIVNWETKESYIYDFLFSEKMKLLMKVLEEIDFSIY